MRKSRRTIIMSAFIMGTVALAWKPTTASAAAAGAPRTGVTCSYEDWDPNPSANCSATRYMGFGETWVLCAECYYGGCSNNQMYDLCEYEPSIGDCPWPACED